MKNKNINFQVKKLIYSFNQVQEQYIKKSRDILLEIIDLRRIQNAEYSYQDLENEKGLEEHKDKIRYFVKYEGLNQRTMKLENEGKISSSDTMLVANLPKQMVRENQDEIVDKVISGEVTREDLIQAYPTTIYKKLGKKGNVMKEELKELLETVYAMGHIITKLERKKHLFKLKKNRDLLEREYKRLGIVVKNILNKY